MKMTRTKLVATLFAVLLMFAVLPSASSADRDVGGMGVLRRVDVAAQSVTVGMHRLQVTHRSRFFDQRGTPLSLEDLVEHVRQDARFVGYRAGGEIYLTKLELTDEELQ